MYMMVRGEILLMTLIKGILGYLSLKKTLSIYLYFAQLRHRQENTDLHLKKIDNFFCGTLVLSLIILPRLLFTILFLSLLGKYKTV